MSIHQGTGRIQRVLDHAPQITLTEQRLCKIWASTQMGGDFYETSKTLHEIAAVLNAVDKQDAALLFSEASALALHRSIEDIKEVRVAA